MTAPMSLFISAVAKPGLKSLLVGEVGTGPGTGQFVCTAQQLPVAPVSTMLLHGLAAWPVPEAPQ
jgi:hypothetical protein